jgi:hypothetical protein
MSACNAKNQKQLAFWVLCPLAKNHHFTAFLIAFDLPEFSGWFLNANKTRTLSQFMGS